MGRAALKVVERAPFFIKDVELWEEQSGYHSLHDIVSYPGRSRPESSAFFIDEYSQPGDIVLDPFCGSGTVALAAAMAGRVAYFSDINPLALKIARAKIEPADIAEVALRLQQIDLSRPIDVTKYSAHFQPFYDLDTFREIVNLKTFIQSNYDRCSRFIELLALGILHGQSAGYLSTYTSSLVSVLPEEQESLNIKRRQNPDYRPVVARILRKAAFSLRDSIPSALYKGARFNFNACSADELGFVENSSVKLILTTPALPETRFPISDLWLRLWFSSVPTQTFSQDRIEGCSLRDWKAMMKRFLAESSRVLAPGGRVVLNLESKPKLELDEFIRELVSLNSYLELEGTYLPKSSKNNSGKGVLAKNVNNSSESLKILVIRKL